MAKKGSPSTAYGKRAQKQAQEHKLAGRQAIATGAVLGAGAVLTALPAPGAATVATAGAMIAFTVAENKYSASRATAAKGRAVEGSIQRGRGGSTALGMRGVSAGQMQSFVERNEAHRRAEAANDPAISADTFQRTRRDYRSGKEITETVRKKVTR